MKIKEYNAEEKGRNYMNNQEQQFYPSGQYPPSPQQSHQYYQTPNSVNVDPREQQSQEMYGESEYHTGRGEKLRPHPPRRKGFRAFWLVPIVLFFLIGGMSFGLFGPHEQFSNGFGPHGPFDKGFGGPGYEQSFKVGATPKLIIKDTSGNVHIHSSEDSSNAQTVTVRMDRGGRSEPNSLVSFDQMDNIITIDTTQQGFGDNNVDLDITTPSTSNVQVNDNNGDVNIEDVTGGVTVQTTQGRIDANNVSGPVMLSSTNGDISLENGSLSGPSSLRSDNGNISYNGSIASQGSYTFETLSGSIDVGLPSNTEFRLDVQSSNGHVENDFAGNDVGSGAAPQVTVISGNGPIQISKNG